jgi:hypothetical protein
VLQRTRLPGPIRRSPGSCRGLYHTDRQPSTGQWPRSTEWRGPLGRSYSRGPAVAAAVAELVHLILIVVAVVAGLAAVGVVALAAFHVHRWRAGSTVQRSLPAPLPQRAVQRAPAPGPAIEQHVHHHWHDVSAAEVAAIIRAQQEDQSQPGG